MSVPDLTTYEGWDLQKAIIPVRSRLYQLEPIGIGTPYVESLTGYIARLALSHSVLPGVLMSKELVPLIDKVYVSKGATRGLPELFNRATALNGLGTMATDLVGVLETLTVQKNLRFLTCLSWKSVFPPHNLFRECLGWCPHCYEEWYQAGQLYDPLLWTIDAVKICPRHHQQLCFHCPHCQQQQRILTWRSQLGFCDRCSEYLGIASETQPTMTSIEWRYSMRAAINIGELFAMAPTLPSLPTKENVALALKRTVDTVTGGNQAALARLFGIPKNTMWMWYSGKVLPQLNLVVEICDFLEVSILDFLTQDSPTNYISSLRLKPSQVYQTTVRADAKTFNSISVKAALLVVLKSEEEPPPTMKEVAVRLGYDKRIIYKYFPDLCQAISAISLLYRTRVHNQKIEQYCEDVRFAAMRLHHEAVYPTEAAVSELISKPGYFRYKKVRAALSETQRQLS